MYVPDIQTSRRDSPGALKRPAAYLRSRVSYSSSWLDRFDVIGRNRRPSSRQTLDQNCATGKCRPEQQPFGPTSSNDHRKRRGKPQTQTVETVEQSTPETVADRSPNMHDRVSRPILGNQQVRYPPDTEESNQESSQRHLISRSVARPGRSLCCRRSNDQPTGCSRSLDRLRPRE
jgi:hypothetical protein